MRPSALYKSFSSSSSSSSSLVVVVTVRPNLLLPNSINRRRLNVNKKTVVGYLFEGLTIFVQAVTERPNMASSSPDARLSDTEPILGRGRDEQSPDSVWSWQTVVVITSSITVLLLVVVITAVSVWKLCRSGTGNPSEIILEFVCCESI